MLHCPDGKIIPVRQGRERTGSRTDPVPPGLPACDTTVDAIGEIMVCIGTGDREGLPASDITGSSRQKKGRVPFSRQFRITIAAFRMVAKDTQQR
jgi:hypothetical protein